MSVTADSATSVKVCELVVTVSKGAPVEKFTALTVLEALVEPRGARGGGLVHRYGFAEERDGLVHAVEGDEVIELGALPG